MSNRRKLRRAASSRPAERCSGCGHRIGKLQDALRIRTGQVFCPRCRQTGEHMRCPGCGRAVLPGSFIVRNAGGYNDVRCPACAPDDAANAGIMLLGMAPRKAG